MTGAVTWGLVVSSLAVIVVRRRSLAIALVAAQSLGLGLYALTQESHTSTALAVTGTVLIAKALVLPALLLLTVRRARKERLIATELPALGRLAIAVAAALAFCLVIVAETGRQPVDNPDTHLELTMVHEGPLLEYAGRDLAYLQWAAAARHWIMLVLACELLIPHPGPFVAQLAVLAGGVLALSVALAVCETVQAKMRVLRVPLLLGSGAALCLLGLASWFAGSGG